MALPDHYATLGVLPNATDVTIKKAYRRLVLRYHPDRNPGNRAAEDQFKRVAQAYEVLSRTDKRAEYDELLGSMRRSAAERTAASMRRQQYARRPQSARRSTRSHHRARETYRTNDFDKRDLLNGMVWGGAFAIYFGNRLTHEPVHFGKLTLILWSCLPFVGGWAGKRFGAWAERQWEKRLARMRSNSGLAYSMLPLFTPISVLIFVCLAVPLAHFGSHRGLMREGILAAAVAASLGATVGSGFGRAFTWVAVRADAKLAGVLIGGLVGGGCGGVLGFFLALNQLSHYLRHGYHDSMLTTILAGAAGAALVSLHGSRRPA